jgi:hypothetical protein
MKASIETMKDESGFFFIINIHHDLLMFAENSVTTETKRKKGQLKREVIQFCAALNLEIEWS